MLKFDKIGPEWGRRGSPRAHTQSQRSHGLQEGFWIPPGPPGHHIMSKNGKKVENPKIKKEETHQVVFHIGVRGCPNGILNPWA